MTAAYVSTFKRCEAFATGRAATDWGMTLLPCNSRRGLRTFRDRNGEERYFCASLGHERNAKRRFGVTTVEPCFLCGRTRMVDLGLFTRVVIGDSVALLCDTCREKGDEDDE